MTSGQKSFSLSLCCKAVESEKNSFADKKDVNGYVAKVIIDIFSSPNISLAVGKEKAPIETASLFTETTPKHKTAFSMLKFTVFFFGISRKAFKKAGKALKTAPFVSFRAKA